MSEMKNEEKNIDGDIQVLLLMCTCVHCVWHDTQRNSTLQLLSEEKAKFGLTRTVQNTLLKIIQHA